MTMIYQSHPETGEFIGAREARADWRTDRLLVPAHAFTDPPPETGEHEVAVRQKNKWKVEPDWRGHRYWLEDGSEIVITKIGETPPPDALDAPPPPPDPPRALSAEAFWGVVEDVDGLRQQIADAIDGISGVADRRAMRAVLRRDVIHYESQSMAQMRALIGMDDATFEALWAEGEALQEKLAEID